MAISGGIIEFADSGDVVAKAGMLYLAESEIKRITKSLRLSIDAIESKAFDELPALNYGIDKNEIAKYALKDINPHQKRALSTVSRIVIYKDEDFNTSQLTGYAQKLASLNTRNEELSKQNDALHEQVKKLTKQKKQYRLVIVLVLVLLGSLVGLYFFNKNVQELQADLASKRETISSLQNDVKKQKDEIGVLNSTISSQKGTILDLEKDVARKSNTCDSLFRENSTKESRIESLQDDNLSLRSELSSVKKKNESLNTEVSSLKRKVSNIPSFFVTEVLMDCGSGDYKGQLYASQSSYIGAKVKYYGIQSGSKTLYWKIFDPSGTLRHTADAPSGYSIAQDVNISTGNGVLYLTGIGDKKTGGYWNKGTYRIEIYEKSGRVIASQYFELK
ncbi:MAG: hypothetical protein IJT74_01640 [Bacteroidales bacterium]|nr:hypothetical protein [Bacteroidales bacterium]